MIIINMIIIAVGFFHNFVIKILEASIWIIMNNNINHTIHLVYVFLSVANK